MTDSEWGLTAFEMWCTVCMEDTWYDAVCDVMVLATG
jgi:hypothetical protein